ncbi:hypothetical protein BC826DRAFT_1012641 [Russula brevipes]|nr:hypothetical protein BC826DRAFT_1012641 [Russula brevipes]
MFFLMEIVLYREKKEITVRHACRPMPCRIARHACASRASERCSNLGRDIA